MIIGSQSVNFNKNGLGYKGLKKEKSYYCLMARGQAKTNIIVRKWVPREYLVNPVEPNLF